jgi:Zn-dependent protease with chaperone function
MLGKPNAEYFDGNSAHSYLAHVSYDGRNLSISRDGHPAVIWRITEVELVSGGKRGQALRLKQAGNHGSRLTLPEGELADRIVDSQQHIRRGHINRFIKGAAVAIAIVLVLGAAAYATLAVAPSALAGLLPDRVVNSFADGLEKSVIKSAKRCNAPAGEAALNKMMKRVLSGAQDPPTFSLRVFDIRQANKSQLVNAFALPGGRMVVSAGLIDKAQSPDEVAGVLAHELGHVSLRHPEAAIVRVYGLQAIISIFTAGQGAEAVSSVAGILAVLSYSREAEEDADTYAIKVMERAQIDPRGLRTFFIRLFDRSPLGRKKTQGSSSAGDGGDTTFSERLKPLSDMFSTHPGTKSRIERLKPREGGSQPPVLTNAEWQALKKICNS